MEANLNRVVIDLEVTGGKAFAFEDVDTGKAYAVPASQITGIERDEDNNLVLYVEGSYTFPPSEKTDAIEALLRQLVSRTVESSTI